MYNSSVHNPQTRFPSSSMPKTAMTSNFPHNPNTASPLKSRYNQQMPVPVKRPLTFYNDENKENQAYSSVKRAKDQREGSEMSEGDVSNGEQLSESESETRSSTASEVSNQGTQPAISINPIAHSTPIIPVQQGHDAGNYWGSGSTATQFQMASYLGYTSHNYLNPNFTNNYYANNPLVNNQQQMMANFSSQSLSNLNPNHLPIAPVNQHPPFTANNFLPSNNNSAHYNPALNSGLGRVVHGGQHSGSSGSSASTSSRTDESYSNEPAEHKNILTPYHEQQPNPHQVYQANYPLIVPDLPLCEVPGRLILLTNHKKYMVTLSEINRRISPPECLNASFLGGILRKAKNKNGGTELRNNLKRYGMSLPSGRRKSQPCTTFTSLCEDEAKQMGKDYFTLCKELFPSAALANLSLAAKPVVCSEETSKRLNSVQWANQIVHNLITTIQSFEQSSLPVQQPVSSISDAENAARDGVVKFSRLTHGFGNGAMITAWQAFQEFLNNYALELNKTSMVKQETLFIKPSPSTSSHASLPNHQ